MKKNKKEDLVRGMFSNCTFHESVVAGIAESGSEVFYDKRTEKPKETSKNEPATKDNIIEYVGRLLPVVDKNYKEDFTNIWQDILAEDAVSKVVYDRGRQKGTVFNRNLVAHISRMMVLEGIFIEQTNDVMMAELLEPEKGKDHPVRTQLGLTPDDIQVKKAVERVFKQHGVKVK